MCKQFQNLEERIYRFWASISGWRSLMNQTIKINHSFQIDFIQKCLVPRENRLGIDFPQMVTNQFGSIPFRVESIVHYTVEHWPNSFAGG
jgi:hypothetical protein